MTLAPDDGVGGHQGPNAAADCSAADAAPGGPAQMPTASDDLDHGAPGPSRARLTASVALEELATAHLLLALGSGVFAHPLLYCAAVLSFEAADMVEFVQVRVRGGRGEQRGRHAGRKGAARVPKGWVNQAAPGLLTSQARKTDAGLLALNHWAF